MPAATRSAAVELHENAEAITAWRNTLPEQAARSPAIGHKTLASLYGATPGKRGLVSVPARGHCRRMKRSRYGDS
jgi:hypothetical protein